MVLLAVSMKSVPVRVRKPRADRAPPVFSLRALMPSLTLTFTPAVIWGRKGRLKLFSGSSTKRALKLCMYTASSSSSTPVIFLMAVGSVPRQNRPIE